VHYGNEKSTTANSLDLSEPAEVTCNFSQAFLIFVWFGFLEVSVDQVGVLSAWLLFPLLNGTFLLPSLEPCINQRHVQLFRNEGLLVIELYSLAILTFSFSSA
jgi:hypothetical protein